MDQDATRVKSESYFCGHCRKTVIDFYEDGLGPEILHPCVKFDEPERREMHKEDLLQLAEPKTEPSKVVHPKHYNKGIECWDYTSSHKMGFLDGNVVKYVTRYKHKNGLEDLYKAQQYLTKLIEVEEAENGNVGTH